ncbi:LacI family DNA-binding transcriptional regulator [Thalassococcus profundi]|uniref:LacI family DNA-binding transcriptional regulator n=1 Tax=Thalassococcus profundi TaxID=2282382 RepID=A0A369TP36_9RHOB|nr:substrate-binding domain-containing protein [Thalassococcus profundi]RDD66940.1 LacI family DNA-binding transcriptional regulator [Thalassococcus profundi]
MNLKQLAEHLGLSQTTVSRALNGYPEVREATRLRVQEAARLHNYTPNARAKGLATGRAMSIGHVIPVSKKHEMVNPVFADFITGSSEVYTRAGYDLVISLVEDGAQEQRYRDLRAKGNVDGLIVHGPQRVDSRIDFLADLGIPFVVHGRASDMTADYSWIDMNNRRAFRRATQFLIDLGHRRIALINGIEAMDFAYRRREGYRAALENAGLTPDPALLFSGEMTEELGYNAMRQMLAAPAPPTAVVTSSIVTAIGVRHALDEAGLVMGRDVSLVSHDDDLSYLRNRAAVPVFTATRSPVRSHGALAAEMLLELIADPGSGPRHRMLEAELIIGRSTGPAPQS